LIFSQFFAKIYLPQKGYKMLGYIDTDITDMIDALDSVLTTINSDDDPWLYNNTWRAKDLLEGLLAEGHVS
jgi:hypothetical protein